jgi:hypothetical protein
MYCFSQVDGYQSYRDYGDYQSYRWTQVHHSSASGAVQCRRHPLKCFLEVCKKELRQIVGIRFTSWQGDSSSTLFVREEL